MSSRRTLKAASAIREVVSMAILTELRDPRVQNVTVTFVELSSDMRYARIHVSVMGSQKEQDLCLHGLRRAAGFLQKRLSDQIDTRYTPRLQFVLDQGIKNAMKVAEILNEVLPETRTAPHAAEDEELENHLDEDLNEDLNDDLDEDLDQDLNDDLDAGSLDDDLDEEPIDDDAQNDRHD